MKVLGIIPARGGSKGIPGKNIKQLGGKSLLSYTADAAKESRLLTRVILSSEDKKIIDVARDLGIEVPFIRPEFLATDTTSSLEVILHALEYLRSEGEEFDAVCLLQPTTPFRKNGLIDESFEKFINGNFDSLISVREVPSDYNPHWVFTEENHALRIATGEKEIISRRQDLPKAYYRDGAVYFTKTAVLREHNSLYGERIGYVNTTGSPYINLDEPSDWAMAEEILKNQD